MNLTTAQIDRVAGTMLGLACGDALGAGLEFQPRVPYTQPIHMSGGGSFNWAPGEWTDDTAMAMCIASVSSQGLDLRSVEAQDQIARAWLAWAATATDVGIQTRKVLTMARSEGTAEALSKAAAQVHAETGRSGGNGSLMRTAPVALAHLNDQAALVQAAREISSLTHFDDEAGDACVLWCLAIRHAILHGDFAPMTDFLAALPESRQALWAERIAEAEHKQSHEFANNGWVVSAFQAAWSAITHSQIPADLPSLRLFPAAHFEIALERAVRCGDDTDTVGAIAGSLLGARWGSTAVPSRWQLPLHGFPDASHFDLVSLAVLTALKGQADNVGWPTIDKVDYSSFTGRSTVVDFGNDGKLSVGGSDILTTKSGQLSAAVSLCRIGRHEAGLEPTRHLPIMLIDRTEPEHNPNLEFCLHNAATAVNAFLESDHRTALHCVQAQSRTPSVLALVLMQTQGLSSNDALNTAMGALPDAHPNVAFQAAMARFDGSGHRRYSSAHGILELGQMQVQTNEDDEICSLIIEIPEGVFKRKGGAWIVADATWSDTRWTSRIHPLSNDPASHEQCLNWVQNFDEYEFENVGGN